MTNFAYRELFAFFLVGAFPNALRTMEASFRTCNIFPSELFKKLMIREAACVLPAPLSPVIMIDCDFCDNLPYACWVKKSFGQITNVYHTHSYIAQHRKIPPNF